ncbi:hypothetical protein V2J09_024086 [Rumex salicifolius]
MATQTAGGKAAGFVAAVLLLLTATRTVTFQDLTASFPSSLKLGNPKEDPLFLWLTGGPGCSSFCAIVYENGPIEFNISNYEGGLPSLNYYPYAWTKTASILFLDSPIGTGFSYSTTSEGWPTSDSKSSNVVYHFFLKWLQENPKYLPLQTYIAGDSYSGIIVPLVTKLIVQGLEAQVQPRINLKTAKESCHENYVDVDPTNTDCVLALAQYDMCVKDLYTNCILEPKCTFARPHETWNRRSLGDNKSRGFIFFPPKIEELWCRNFNYALSMDWANDPLVREALHVRKDTVQDWVRCNSSLDYTTDVQSVIDVHKYLTTKQLNVLVESGDRDMTIPFVGTVKWIKSLNLTVDEQWRPWFVDGQVAGYTEKYYTSKNGYRLVFATVKGAGHTAPEYQRRRCYEMFRRWVHWYPL